MTSFNLKQRTSQFNVRNVNVNVTDINVLFSYTVFTMRGTVALRSPIQTVYDRRALELQLSCCIKSRRDKVIQIHKNQIYYVFIMIFLFVCLCFIDNIEGIK